MSELEVGLEPGRGRAVRLREAVVQAARRFKSTWVELGRLLVEVRRENLFGHWGYDSFEVVEVLAQAEERGQLSSDEYRTIRESIWDPARAPSELKRELSARFPQPAPDRDHALGRLAQTARRLANELRAVAGIPRAVGERAASLADELERLAGAEPRNRSQGG